MGVFLSALDSSIVNVSLWTMARDFGVGMADIQWVTVAYLLVLTSLMPLGGKMGDRVGKTRIFQMGIALFTLGSLSCALSPTLAQLVASRVFQAIGSSMMTANGLALVTYFTTPENRGRAMGLNSITLAIALAAGPVLGGILTQFYGWPSIFLVNLPLGVLGYLLVRHIVPRTEPVREVSFDVVGAALFFLCLFSLVYAVSVARDVAVEQTVLFAVVSIVSFVVLLIRERRFISPIIPTRVMADRRIWTSIVSAILSFMAMIPISFLMPFLLQDALGLTQGATGLFLTVHPIVISVFGPISGVLSERVQARVQTVIGLIIQAVGLWALALSVPNLALMVASIIVLAIGLSLFTVANGNFVMTAAPKEYMGVMSALTNIARTTGFSVATALATTVFSFYFGWFNPLGLTSGTEYVTAYVEGYRLTACSFSVFLIIGAIVSWLRGRLHPSEEARSRPKTNLGLTPPPV